MCRKLSAIALLLSLNLIAASAPAQWPPDDLLNQLPPVSPSVENESIQTAQRTVTEALPEVPALEELSVPDETDSWILPTYWFNAVDWDGGVEIGISGTAGNSESASFRFGANLKRKTDINKTTFKVTYLKATADGTENQHNAIQNFGYERSFGASRYSLFIKEALEYDEFKAFDLRLALNGGLGYQFIDTDATKLNGRFGAGVSHEFGGPNDEWVPELVYGMDFERQLTERQKLALTVDYFPEWGNFSNYRVVSDFGWEVLLDEKHNLNLKLSVNDRYDSTPNGRRPNDVNYALLLLWKM